MHSESARPAKSMKHIGGYKQINQTLNILAFEDYLEAQIAHLPALADVQQLSPRVIRILGKNAGQFTLQGTNTYIVGTGTERLIIDTGQGRPEWIELVLSTVAQNGFSLSKVLLTHWHGDHTGGVPDLRRHYPHLSSEIYKHSPDKHQQPIKEGQGFAVEGATVRAVHAPGHSTDHMCFVLEEENALFTGDNILGHGTTAIEDLGQFMRSLHKMERLKCQIGYPAHGDVIKNLPAKMATEISQKVRREKQILDTLNSFRNPIAGIGGGKTGNVTTQELVVAMYGDKIDEGVREQALQPFIEEVLKKLAEDGRVAFHMRGGRRRWFTVVE